MTTWFKQLGFNENPLDARPNPLLVGLEDEEDQLKTYILKEELCFLNGLTGAGKTSLLKKVQEALPDHKFIYLDADALPPDFDLEEAIVNKRGFLDKITFRKFPKKKPVLIIDEFQATDPNLILQARSNWENPNEKKIKSIVIAQISKNLKNTPGSFKDRLGNRVITVKQLDNEEMKRILELRLKNNQKESNYYQRISDDAANLLVQVADGNARRLLEFTDLIFDFHYRRFGDINPLHKKEDYLVTFHAPKEILNVNNINTEGYELEEGTTEKDRKTMPFEKQFTVPEQNVLRSLQRDGELNYEEISRELHTPTNKSKDLLAKLKKKGAIVSVGKKKKKTKWALTQSTLRLMVKR